MLDSLDGEPSWAAGSSEGKPYAAGPVWNGDAWMDATDPFFDAYESIGIDAHARGNEFFRVQEKADAADLTEAIVKRLRMFVLRAKVVFEPLPDYAAAAVLDENAEAHAAAEPSLSFPAAEENGVWTVSLPHTGRLKIGAAERLPEHDAAAENAWNLHEIRSGYAWISAATKETAVAQMLNQHIIGGVHFKKGCYPGQEIIARAQYRGQVKRGLAVLSGGSLEAAGIAVLENGAEAGQIINTALTDTGSLSLAVIKHAAAQAVLTDADGNSLKQEKLFFNIELKE